jgi:RNA polymerase sigma-70 factor (ECF subfamily)
MREQETSATNHRTNQQWLEALRGPDRDQALADLRAGLLRGLRYALADRPEVSETDLEDFAQEAIVRVLDNLDSFRGESRFTTWAQKIAVRVALTELRRLRWRDVSFEDLTGASDTDFLPRALSDSSAGPEQRAMQSMVLEALREAISEQLTERQRRAIRAVYQQGMPLEEVARRMGTNRNALYKLLHDARQRIREVMIAQGLSSKDALDAFEP